MNALNRLFRWIETKDALLCFLLLALMAQVPQVAELVLYIVGHSDWLAYLHAYAFAVALDGAILIFVTRGRVGLAWVFAAGSMAMNTAHYLPPVLARHDRLDTPQAIMDIVGALLLSVALPFALAQYSHVAAEHEAHLPHEQAVPAPSLATPLPIDVPAELPAPEPEPAAHQCDVEGCTIPALACQNECGSWVCMTHKGSHVRWHCTHRDSKKASPEALEVSGAPSNGHFQDSAS